MLIQVIIPWVLREDFNTMKERGDLLLSRAFKDRRFLVSKEWDDFSKAIKQRVLPRLFSDDFPIILECGDWEKGKGYFKFENICLDHENYVELID